ncbi:mechanosensitive ion channel family protein, partial [archaeon]|nr:mechanosensitive ion channel family protein [archaeon]
LYINALIVFAIFFIASFVIRYVFTKILSSLVKGTKTDIDDKIIETAQKPMLFFVIIVGVFLSGYIIHLDDLIGLAYSRIFITIIMYIIFILTIKIIMIIIHGTRESVKDKRRIKAFDKRVFPFFERMLKIVGFAIYFFVFFSVWDINLAPLLASAGVLGLAVAFAAKDTISNIFGGLAIFFDKPYEIGDYVVIDNERGEVVDIGLRSTKIKTRDDVFITIPNSVMASSKVINQTGILPKLRVRIDVGVSYDSDLEKVEKVLMDLAKNEEYIEKNPPAKVRYRTFGDFGINLQFSFWTKNPALKGRHTHFIIKKIHKIFKKENIKIPYPTQELYINNQLNSKK